MVHTCAWTSCLLKVAILHHFPSRVGLCLLRFVPLFIYGLFCRPLSGTTSLPEWSSVCSVTHPCSLRNFLNATVIRHFPSRVMECLLRCTPLFTYGIIQRLKQLHLRLDEFF